MRESGFEKDKFFDETTFLMYLVCIGRGVNQHAAALVEGLIGDRICIWLFDIYAYTYESGQFEGLPGGGNLSTGKICNVREIAKSASLSDNDEIEALYKYKSFNHVFRNGYFVRADHFFNARKWAVKDQIRTARGISEVFLEAERDQGMREYIGKYAYFLSQKEVEEYFEEDRHGSKFYPFKSNIFGVLPIMPFLTFCSYTLGKLKEVEGGEMSFYQKGAIAANYLRIVNSFGHFLSRNLKKMKADSYLNSESVTPLKNFNAIGPRLLWDTRSKEERREYEPVNCTRWIKDFFEEAGIRIKNPSDQPKKAAKGCSLS